MTRSKLLALASLIAAGLLGSASQAQQQPPAAGGPPSGQPQGQQQSNMPYPGQPSGTVGGPPAPVVFVTSVEVLRSDRNGGLDVVRVRGLVTGQSWTQPHLIPITQGAAARRHARSHLPGERACGRRRAWPVHAGRGHPAGRDRPSLQGRARARRQQCHLAQGDLPGFAETPAPKEDCAKCIGKFFVAKGANPPAGATADNTCARPTCPTRCASSSRPTAFRATRSIPTG